MVKKISYAISQPYQWLFIILGALAAVSTITPYVVVAFQDGGMHYNTVSNVTLLIANTILPVAVAVAAAAMTHRRGLARWWIAVGVGFMATVIDQLFMWLGSVFVPANYDIANVAALVLGVGIALAAVWTDRRAVRPAGWRKYWRLLGVGALYLAMIVAPVVDAFRSAGYGQPVQENLQSFGWALLVLTAVIAMTAVIFRRLPGAEQIKRVLLALTGLVLASMAFGGLTWLPPLRDADWMVSLWLGIAVLGVVYVASIWWLRPVRQPRTLRVS